MELSIAKKWYDKGQEEQDKFDKFIYHWIAFNALYDQNQSERHENKRIVGFVSKNYSNKIDILLKMSDPLEIFKQRSVERLGRWNIPKITNTRYHKVFNEKLPNKMRIINLLLTIYQVRCNLFHGGKNPDGSRSLNLVKAASILLENYLSNFLSKDNAFQEMKQ